MILGMETLLIVEQLFTHLLWNQQQDQRILSMETPLNVEQIFTHLLWNQQQDQRILIMETPLIVEQLFTDLLQVHHRKQLSRRHFSLQTDLIDLEIPKIYIWIVINCPVQSELPYVKSTQRILFNNVAWQEQSDQLE